MTSDSWRIAGGWCLLCAAAVLLVWVALAHPSLRLVDFLSFSNRARRLLDGQDWIHPQYPVGYPLVLAGLQAVTGDILVAGKVLSILSGVGAVVASWVLVGRWAALWLLFQPALLVWGTTEGTDMPAAAMSLGALALASRGRWAASGGVLGVALLCRYTAIGVLPGLFWLVWASRSESRRGALGRMLVAGLVVTALHWGVALFTGASWLPGAGSNLEIGGGGAGGLWSMQTMHRFPRGWWESARIAAADGSTMLGIAGLVLGAVWGARSWRGTRQEERGGSGPPRREVALALVIYASSHLAILAVFFPNPRLALPVTLALALGAAWIRPWWLLATATGFVGFASVPGAMKLEPAEAALAAVAREVSDLRGPFLSTSPWFYKQEDGWLVPSIPMREAGGDPRRLSPTGVLAFARRAGFRHVVVDAGRVGATYPGLRSLLRSEPPAGLELVVDRDGWRVYAVGDPQPTDP